MTSFATKLTAFFTSILMFLGGIYCAFLPTVTDGAKQEKLLSMSGITKKHEIADKVYMLDNKYFSTEELDTAISLQGITAKEKPCIYIKTNGRYNDYLKEIEKSGKIIVSNDENGQPWNLYSLVSELKDSIEGYTLYKSSEFAESMNMAFNLATVNSYIAVSEGIESKIAALGIDKKEDFTDDKCDMAFQYKFFDKYKDKFDLSCFIHVKDKMKGLRDYAIQQGYFIFYSDFSTMGNILREHIMRNAHSNFIFLGWGEYEKKMVESLSKFGGSIIPADHCYNNSILSSFICDIPEQTGVSDNIPTDETKHYAAIVYSDGDNLQWVQGGFYDYYYKLSKKMDFPMTWTYPVIAQDMSPVTSKLAYQAAGKNNYFIAGGTGLGYIHTSLYPAELLDEYTEKTASQMAKSNLRIVSFIDNYPDTIAIPAFTYTFDWFSRFDNIDGGILMLDPNRYAGGNGEVWFSNDKPFISVRFSLWHPDGEEAEVTDEWLSEQADIVNSYNADIHSINGYTVINVHPWSIGIDKLCSFVEKLDEHIELVTMDEMIAMLTANIPHENAKPQ